MKFTQIPEKLKYNIRFRGILSSLHRDIIDYVLLHYEDSLQYRRKVISLMNRVSYAVICGDSVSLDLNASDALDSIPISDDVVLDVALKGLYLDLKSIDWDIDEHSSDVVSTMHLSPHTDSHKDPISKAAMHNVVKSSIPTAKDDLYLRPPIIPHVDMGKVWLNFFRNGVQYTLYATSPTIPTTQREISLTTDVSLMGMNDLLNLFPNRFIPTRNPVMYTPISGLEFDDKLGVIFPIDGFTSEQIKQNIIQYPHIYKLDRWVGDNCVSFYNNIEVNGSLYATLEVWDSLPESKVIPKTSEFIKEYVARRYLLERDIKGITHKYPLRGELNPFLTLFTTPEDYRLFGYDDSIDLAEKCVKSRVSYWVSRNPTLMLYSNPKLLGCASADCIYKSYCSKAACDSACPTLVETSYLRERNGLIGNIQVFKEKQQTYSKLLDALHTTSTLGVLISDNTVSTANALTYAAICEHWQGNRLHCSVYHFRLSNYIESLQRSWQMKEVSDSFDYEQIWLSQAKVLIISGLDYIQFKDFHAQTLLNIIQDRISRNLSTFIVSPKINTLVGSGVFFGRLKQLMEGAKLS